MENPASVSNSDLITNRPVAGTKTWMVLRFITSPCDDGSLLFGVTGEKSERCSFVRLFTKWLFLSLSRLVK